MYLERDANYKDQYGQTHRRRTRFLLLVQDRNRSCGRMNFRALVRCVSLRQCGQFMMGFTRVKGKRLTVSGAYGGDGLPMDVDSDVFAEALPVPESLYELWGKGGGHNCSGNESEWFRNWAISVFPATVAAVVTVAAAATLPRCATANFTSGTAMEAATLSLAGVMTA